MQGPTCTCICLSLLAHFRGCYVQASMELEPENVSLLGLISKTCAIYLYGHFASDMELYREANVTGS